MATESQNKNTTPVKKSTKKRVAKKSVTMAKKKITNPDEFVSITKSVGTASVIMVALIVAITPGSTWVAGPVVGAMCIFGIASAYFASK